MSESPLWNCSTALHKKWSFPLRIFSVNVTKSAVFCGFGHIYWRNLSWKTWFFVQYWWQRHETFLRTYPGVTYFRNLKSKQNLFQNKTIKRSYCCSDFFHKKTTNFNETLLYYVKNWKVKPKYFCTQNKSVKTSGRRETKREHLSWIDTGVRIKGINLG